MTKKYCYAPIYIIPILTYFDNTETFVSIHIFTICFYDDFASIVSNIVI